MSSDVKRSGSASIKSEDAVKRESSEGSGKLSSSRSTSKAPMTTTTTTKESSPPPPTTFRDIPLYSTSLEDWNYHLMKLASFSKVDPSDTNQFPWPVKLNRKWPPKLKDDLPLQGDSVLDQWGKPIMIPPKRDANDSINTSNSNGLMLSELKRKTPLLWPGPDDDVDEVEEFVARLDGLKGPTADTSLIGPSNTANLATRAKGGLFQKRVREVYKASSMARKTRNEEIIPWVLEDYETSKEWESRRRESRRGLKALQQGIKVKREGGRFPSRAAISETEVKMEEDGEEEKKVKAKENHAPWIGKLEGEAHESASTSAGGAMSHALFIFDERGAGGFRVVPVSRMYKFLQRPAHANNLTWEEAEKAFERHQKAQVGEGISKFLSRNNVAGGVTSRQARAKDEEEDRSFFTSLSQSKGLHLPGTSFRGDNKLASLYDRDSSARRNNLMAIGGASGTARRVKDEEGTYGELDFEEDFADDEERNEGDDYAMGEEETKELEQRIKKELAKAEEDGVDDLFDERGRSRNRREDDVLTGSGKQMKKIMKALARREGNDVYDDDDEDRNPYGSDDSSDGGEDSVMANPEEALRRVREEREREAKEAAKKGIKTQDTSQNASRASSPAPIKKENSGISTPANASGGRPGETTSISNQQTNRKPGAGHATSAQRATSTNRPASNHSRQGSRSGSPVNGTSSNSNLKRKSQASSSNNNNGKRPRTSTQQSSGPSSPIDTTSPRSASPSRPGTSGKNSLSSIISPPNELEVEIIKLVQSGKAQTTRELITHFKSRLSVESGLKETLLKASARVLNSSNSILSVKPALLETVDHPPKN